MASVFYNLLYFLGIRKCGDNSFAKQIKKQTKYTRKVRAYKDKYGVVSQPRQITRFMYQKHNQCDLSPPATLQCIEIPTFNSDSVGSNDSEAHNVCLSVMSFLDDWSYTIFIVLLLIGLPIHTLYYIITHLDDGTSELLPYYSSLFTQLVRPVQYYYCMQYFSTDHFEQFYYKNNLKDFLDNITYFILFFATSNLIINMTRIITSEYDIEFAGYSEYSQLPRFGISVILFFSWIYGNLVVYTNLVCFCLVFYKHKNIIETFKKNVYSDECELTLNKIQEQLTNIVFEYKTSIGHFERIFSSFTLLGGIALGFYIERFRTGDFSYFPWNNFIVYILMQIMFFFTILDVNGCKNGMTDFIKNPKYTKKYIKRYTIEDIKLRFGEDEKDEKYILMNTVEENAAIVDFIALNQLFNDNWSQFKFFGFDIADFGLIKKGMVIVSMIIAINQLA